VIESIQSLFITTAAQKMGNQGHIGSLQFPLLPFADQYRIVTRVKELRRPCADLRQRLMAGQAAQLSISNALIGSFNNLLTPIESNGLSN